MSTLVPVQGADNILIDFPEELFDEGEIVAVGYVCRPADVCSYGSIPMIYNLLAHPTLDIFSAAIGKRAHSFTHGYALLTMQCRGLEFYIACDYNSRSQPMFRALEEAPDKPKLEYSVPKGVFLRTVIDAVKNSGLYDPLNNNCKHFSANIVYALIGTVPQELTDAFASW